MLKYSKEKIIGLLVLVVVCMVIFSVNRLGFLFNDEILDVTISGDEIEVRTEAASVFINTDSSLDEMVIETKDGKTTLSSGSKHIKLKPMSNVIITLPEEVDTLSVNTISGSIDVNTSAENLTTRSVSGSIRVSDFDGESFTAATTSGDIRCEAITADRVNITSVSGEVETGTVKAEKLNTNSVSGNTSLYLAEVSSGNLVSVSGNISIEAENPSLYHISTVSTTGIVNISSSYTGDNTLRVSTASGNVTAI